MGQIKITISDKEKADIEAKAKAAGMTVSKYLRERIICSPYVSDPTLPETINYQNRARLWAVIPEELLKSINEEAKSAGMGGIGGAGDTVFSGKARGMDALLARVTVVFAVLFAVITLVIAKMTM